MKEGRRLSDVLTELKSQQARKKDLIVPAVQMSLLEDGETFQVSNEAKGEMELFEMSSLAHRQIASALNIPAKYYDFMASQKPDLLAENVNAWFCERDNSYMLRSFAVLFSEPSSRINTAASTTLRSHWQFFLFLPGAAITRL